jgi:hypothetical protein
MRERTRFLVAAVTVLTTMTCFGTASAQIEDQISAYTGDNAEGYLQPLADAIGADLNGGLWSSAYIPPDGFHMSFDTRVVAVLFSDDDETFDATTEDWFSPQQTVEAPTVVGSGDAVVISGDGGAQHPFPGGFSLNSFTLAVPQIRIGSYRGTEALIRYIALDTGDVELGNVSLYGFGLRHSISQYMDEPVPADLAAGFFWQQFSLGDDLIDANAFTFGVQASKRLPAGVVLFEPYLGLSVDMFSMDVAYEYEADDESEPTEIDLSFESETAFRATLGMSVTASIVGLNAEYSLSDRSSFAFGMSLGF